ncbi:hypothetical protein [Candidatus Dormibacter sp.]|uniref:hypothetical protein n=1 Tax=Candidatus Dormibacter sp. TaxID=2973982 RepID=UPI003D9B9827
MGAAVNQPLVVALVAGTAVVAAGIFAACWSDAPRARLASLPALGAGAAIAFAGVSRFAAGSQDPSSGQEMAALLVVASLAALLLGLAFSRGHEQA